MGAHFWPTFFDTISCTFLISPSGWKQTWSEASVGYYSEASVGYYTVPEATALIMTNGKALTSTSSSVDAKKNIRGCLHTPEVRNCWTLRVALDFTSITPPPPLTTLQGMRPNHNITHANCWSRVGAIQPEINPTSN